jgi:hypothetical protein
MSHGQPPSAEARRASPGELRFPAHGTERHRSVTEEIQDGEGDSPERRIFPTCALVDELPWPHAEKDRVQHFQRQRHNDPRLDVCHLSVAAPFRQPADAWRPDELMGVKDLWPRRYYIEGNCTGEPPMNYRVFFASSLCGLALLFDSAPALSANVSFSVALRPPAPVVESIPPPSVPGSVWTPGYWSWNGVEYIWVPGQYVVAPFPGAVWIGGRWVARGHHWDWVDGRWRHR